jgi:hypothetical protein
MAFALEYHKSVRRSIPSSFSFNSLASSLLLLPALFLLPVSAQINGAPASVTSPGFGGRAINGPPASVTSLGPNGYSRGGYTLYSRGTVLDQNARHNSRHHHHYVPYAPPYAYAVPVPYAVDIGATDDVADNGDDSDDNYQGGPTIFDRRGSGARSYIPPVEDVPTPHSQSADATVADPDPPQVQTTLVFKDGRKLDVGNYAIVGQTLFDLTPGHARKVALADLNLDATRQLNDDRGVQFQLPPLQAN